MPEQIVLAGGDGNAERLVRTAAVLATAEFGTHALIGGLAVMCRLAAIHRATEDIDTVTETTEPPAVELIAATAGSTDPTNPNRLFIDGIKVDVIETHPFEPEDLNGLEPSDALFIASHRWALDSAEEVEICVGDASAMIRVATPQALVATKSGAVMRGRPGKPEKRSSDLYDLYRLVVEYDRRGGIAADLTEAPYGLGELVSLALTETVLDDPDRSVRLLRGGVPEARGVTADDLGDVMGPLAQRLRGPRER